MYRLRERLGYKHVEDFLRDRTGGELAGDIAYLRVDDEVQAQRTAIAILKALGRVSKQPAKPAVDDDEDGPPIDTTDPEFAKHFMGFTNTPGGRPQRPMPMQNTQILMG